MRRLMVLVTVMMLMAAMMVFAAPASAEAGCKEFGAILLFEVQLEGGAEVGATISAGAQEEGADDDVNFLKAGACGS